MDTGTFSLNANNAPDITGSDSSAFIQGVDWQVVHGVAVTDGTLNALSGIAGNIGLADLQVVSTPEPTSAALLGFGTLLVAARRRNR